MAMKLIDETYDSFSGITERVFYDEVEDKMTIQRLQDVENIIDENKRVNNLFNPRANYSDSKGVHLVARIPMILIEKWKEEGFNWFESTDNERRAWLDKPEHAFLKVRPGKLGGYRRTPLRSKVGNSDL